jgi:ferric-dicitrate binding protein FerR (iron transport regulator)
MRIESRENSALKFKNIIEETKERSIRIIRYAAIIIGLIGLSALFFYLFNSQSTSQLLTQNVVEVPYGSKLTLTLPDRTRLWINSGSKVIYNNKFGIDNRNIEIIGEAYFDVAKNPKLPFIVHAGDVKIKALGTAFNVKAYPEEKRVETTLVHGTVEVEKDGVKKTILLKPSEKIVIINKEKSSLNGNLSQTEPVNKKKINPVKDLPIEMTIDKRIDTEKETAWKEGKLIFEREPLETLTVQLMRKYDVNFLFTDDRLKTYKFSGTFNDLSLEQIMDAMKFSAPIDYEIIDKKVILKTKAPE